MPIRKSQAERRTRTQLALMTAARTLFAAQGYAATSTPDIVAQAGVTRGALYHHYADKLALFEAVVRQEQLLLAMAVNAAMADLEAGPVKALVAGGEAVVAALQETGRRQILLVDAPGVLGRERLDALLAEQGLQPLPAALQTAMDAKAIRDLAIGPLAQLLTALFERAALAPPEAQEDYRKAIKALIRGLRI